jgi:hypothetical protein
MKLLPKSLISWNEPWFFLLRLRTRQGWLTRAAVALVLMGIMFAVIYFTGRARMGVPQMLLVSAMAGVFLSLLPDLVNLQREVTVYEDSVFFNSAMKYGWSGEFKFTEIHFVQLMRPEDWHMPFGGCLLHMTGDSFLFGVPNKLPLETLANVLHRAGLKVVLIGWEPPEGDSRIQVKDEIEFVPDPTGRTISARIWPVEEQDGKLTPLSTEIIGVVMALGPLALALIGLIAAVVVLIVRWSALSVLDRCLIGGGAVAAVVVTFLYLLLAGQFLAARYMVGVGRSILRTRANAILTGDEAQLTPVEIFNREAWTSTIVKAIDFGFLHLDGARRLLRFEGNKNRWEIPTQALTACRVEEAHVGSEGNVDAEKRYYVVLGAQSDGQPWEVGMIPTRTEMGNDNKDQRYARAQELFGRVTALVGRT